MCRFIVVRSQEKINPKEILSAFSQMCQMCRTPDGDRQGDGWGVAWKTDNAWNLHKSINPIWEEGAFFDTLPGTNLFTAHARSSGFPEHNNIIEFNQPYIDGSLCFVFNGMIRKVRLPFPLEGKIGAQKIFSLVKSLSGKSIFGYNRPHSAANHSPLVTVSPWIQLLRLHGFRSNVNNSISKETFQTGSRRELRQNTHNVLAAVDKIISANAGEIIGMNVALVNGQSVSALCRYTNDANYFSIHYIKSPTLTVVCSEPLLLLQGWIKMNQGQIVEL